MSLLYPDRKTEFSPCEVNSERNLQTHERFKITLFIRTKHNMRIFIRTLVSDFQKKEKNMYLVPSLPVSYTISSFLFLFHHCFFFLLSHCFCCCYCCFYPLSFTLFSGGRDLGVVGGVYGLVGTRS